MFLRELFVTVVLLWSAAVSHAAVPLTIAEGNEISLPVEYAAPQWTAEWFMEDGTRVPDALLRHNSGTSVSILSNIGYVYAVLTDAVTKETARTSAVNADRLRVRVAALRLDGTGSAGRMVFVNNGVTSVQEFSVEIAGIVADAPEGIATVLLPQLVGEYDINVNHPERIGAMLLDGAGISSVDVDRSCRNLRELSLTGNSLRFDGLPAWLPDGCEVSYGSQSPVHISVQPDGMTVDLSAVAVGDVVVSWFDDNGEPIDTGCYERDAQSYVFTGYAGKAWCRMTSASLGLALNSTTVNVGADMSPVFSCSWAGAAGNAVFSVTVSERTAVAVDDGPVQVLEPGDDNAIRLPARSGSLTFYASSAAAVGALDMRDIGLYAMQLHDSATGLQSLLLDGNGFTPSAMPAGIPAACHVDWGRQAVVDISGLSDRQERWIDLTGLPDITATWYDASTRQPLAPAQIVERPARLFTFGADVAGVYAMLKSALYDGLEWSTTEVNFLGGSSSLNTPTSCDALFSVEGNTLVSSCRSELRIYTLDGRLISTLPPMGRCPLSPGLYIVSSAPGASTLIRL